MNCPHCGVQVADQASFCSACGKGGNRGRAAADGPASSVIPVKNAAALSAYYCAIFSLIPCLGLLLGPAAFHLGRKGLKAAQADPRIKGTVHARIGIWLGGLCGLINLIAVLFVAIGIALNPK
jgi:hypothetical protein